MKKFIAVITIVLMISLVACAPKKGAQEGTPTPDNNTQATATPSAGPGDPDFSIDLEEDLLGEGDPTAEATSTSQTESTPTNTSSPEVTGTVAPVVTATPVATPTPTPTEQPIISLPMDFF